MAGIFLLILQSLFPHTVLRFSAGSSPRQTRNKTILLVVDALGHEAAAEQLLPLLRAQDGGRGVFLKSLAMTPTMTTQRIRAMMAGFNPNFFDIKDSFTASAAAEENLICRLREQGMKATFMGDDTWARLYEHCFGAETFPCQSFDVGDLHSCDQRVF
jgi:predicted AlkP superfamily pyrophosphatase or phosphodiesterase